MKAHCGAGSATKNLKLGLDPHQCDAGVQHCIWLQTKLNLYAYTPFARFVCNLIFFLKLYYKSVLRSRSRPFWSEPELLRRGGSGSGSSSSSSSRQNCAHKVNFFHSFFITLNDKIKDWFKLKKKVPRIFFSPESESEPEPPKLRNPEPLL